MAFKKAAAPAAGFNFGELSNYSSGGGIPEGDYCWVDLSCRMVQFTKQDGRSAGPERLCVVITMQSLSGGEPSEQSYSLGTKVHESWAPNPQTGKGLVPVPGGPGTSPNASTNWAVLLKSLFDSGLPQGILQDDLSVLEGIRVHMANVPEPAERKGFQSRTGEAYEERAARTIPVVTEIKDDGKPWEGTGGMPETSALKGARTMGRSTTPIRGAATPTGIKESTATSVGTNGNESLETAALNGIATVLSKNPKGLLKLQLRTGTFKAVSEQNDQETAQKVISTYFSNDRLLLGLLGQHGYTIKGTQVVEA